MFLDLRALLRSGKEQTEFFFEYTPQRSLIEIPSLEIELPIKVVGEITITGAHSAYLQGEISFSVKGECTRCLKQTTNEYLFAFAEQVSNEEDEGYLLKNDKVDLAEIVEDAIAINFPISFLCREDCKGICSGCGVNLNDEQCKCEK